MHCIKTTYTTLLIAVKTYDNLKKKHCIWNRVEGDSVFLVIRKRKRQIAFRI